MDTSRFVPASRMLAPRSGAEIHCQPLPVLAQAVAEEQFSIHVGGVAPVRAADLGAAQFPAFLRVSGEKNQRAAVGEGKDVGTEDEECGQDSTNCWPAGCALNTGFSNA